MEVILIFAIVIAISFGGIFVMVGVAYGYAHLEIATKGLLGNALLSLFLGFVIAYFFYLFANYYPEVPILIRGPHGHIDDQRVSAALIALAASLSLDTFLAIVRSLGIKRLGETYLIQVLLYTLLFPVTAFLFNEYLTIERITMSYSIFVEQIKLAFFIAIIRPIHSKNIDEMED